MQKRAREDTCLPVAGELLAYPAERAVDDRGEERMMIDKPRIDRNIMLVSAERDDVVLHVREELVDLVIEINVYGGREVRDDPRRP